MGKHSPPKHSGNEIPGCMAVILGVISVLVFLAGIAFTVAG